MSVLTYYAPTPAGRVAVERAVSEAQKLATNVHVFNVPPTIPAASDVDLRRILAEAEARGVPVTIMRVNESSKSPLECLIAATDDPEATLVVVGLPRRSAVGKLLLGSVEQQILLRSTVAVLSVKAEDV